MVDCLSIHRFDEANFVGDLSGVRQGGAEQSTAFAILIEGKWRPGERQTRLIGRHAGEPLSLAHGIGQLLTVLGIEAGLVIEQVHLRRAARLIEENDALGLGRDVRAGE